MDAGAVEFLCNQLECKYGIYYGWAWFPSDASVRYPMVMSFGLNPHYGNAHASVVPAYHAVHF